MSIDYERACEAARKRGREKLKTFDPLTYKISGWMFEGEERCLYELAQKSIKGAIVEIGSFKGKSTIALALGAINNVNGHANHIYAIDPQLASLELPPPSFDPIIFDEFIKAERGTDYNNSVKTFSNNQEKRLSKREEFYKAMLTHDCAEMVSLINLPSCDAITCWKRNISLLFIDGDHSSHAVMQDFELWSCFVAKGGVIVLHDTHLEGPAKVAELMFEGGSFELMHEVASLKSFRKSRG